MNENKKSMSRTKKVLLSIFCIVLIAIIAFIIYEISTVRNKYYISQKNLEIPIFVYHDLVKDKSEVQYAYMQTTVRTFEKQVTDLMKLGYTPISYQDLVDYKAGKKQISKWSFLITFDDGYEGVYQYAYPLAKKYNIPMTSFAIDDKVGEDGYYTWDQAKEMHDSQLMHIYSHGLHHIQYDRVPTEKLLRETDKAYDHLTSELSDPNMLKVFTYPYGLCTYDETSTLGQAGYTQNLTDNMINQSKTLNLSRLHRSYPLSDPTWKILLKIQYRIIRYGS